jgi:HK97 family phage portal protein
MWPFNKKAVEAETKSLPSGISDPSPELLELFAGSPTGGFGVSASQALTVPAVQAAIRVISEAVASLDVTVKRKVDGKEVDAPEHAVAKLLNGQANPWTSGYELLRDLVAQALTSDAGGLAWVNRVRGEPREVIHYTPGSITVQYDTKGTGEPEYRLTGKRIKSADVVHLRGAFSRCPLSLAADAIGTAKQMERHAGNLFKNGARPGGVIETPKPVGESGIVKMLAGFKAAYTGGGAGSTAVLWDGSTWKPMTLTSVDAQFLESRKFQNLEIARAFRVPPSMLFEMDRATWSNAEQAAREFITWTLIPWVKALESALNRALLTDEERGEYRIVFDMDDVSQADLTARATAISTLIMAEVINPDQARAWLGMEPRPGGDVYKNPNTSPGAQPPANDNAPKQAAA